MLLTLHGCGEEARNTFDLGGSTMGTSYSLRLIASGTLEPDAVGRAIDARLQAMEQAMSHYRADSDLSRFNRYRGDDWFAVSSDLARVVDAALEVSSATGGAFDITVAPLVELWGFGVSNASRVPGDDAIAAALHATGFAALEVRSDPPALRKRKPALNINVAAIAKGYAVDELAAYVEGLGVRDYLIEIGGEIKSRGANPEGRPWRIGIEQPVSTQRSIQRIITPGDGGVATSGDYRNYFTVDGVRYSHTLDPRTGRPVTHALASVTVHAASVMHADAMATALLVLGPVRGPALARELELAAFFVTREQGQLREVHTARFTEFLVE